METQKATAFNHRSVLSRELIAGLDLLPEGIYLDATAGGGGHSELILAQGENLKLIAIGKFCRLSTKWRII